MGTKYVNIDRETPMLLPVDLREWVAGDDLAHFILEAVNAVDVSQFASNARGSGSEQYPPRMMLALLIYCYSHGTFGSRRIERATYQDLSVRYVAGNTHPDHDTICKFRRENFAAIGECFLRVLQLAKELGLLRVGTVAIDGTLVRANASKHQNVTYARAGELLEALRGDIAQLLAQAEQADREGRVPEGLPEELQRREQLQTKLAAARAALEQRAQAQAQSEQAAYEAKRRAWAERPRGQQPSPPSGEPKATTQINLTDPESRLMRKSKNEGFSQSYNAQAAVTAEGSQLIVGVQVTAHGADYHELEPTLAAIPAALGVPSRVLVDSGYLNSPALGRVMEGGIDVYCAVAAEATMARRRYEYRPKDRRRENPVEPKDPRIVAMQQKVLSEEGRAIYARRQTSVEPAFGIIKSALGFRQFTLRGAEKVNGEWRLVALAYNCKRLCHLRRRAKDQTPTTPSGPRTQRSNRRRRTHASRPPLVAVFLSPPQPAAFDRNLPSKPWLR
jgi:transposase